MIVTMKVFKSFVFTLIQIGGLKINKHQKYNIKWCLLKQLVCSYKNSLALSCGRILGVVWPLYRDGGQPEEDQSGAGR